MNLDNDLTLLLIIITISVIIITLQTILESRRRPREVKTITRTLLRCTKCDYTIETDYEPGDFVSLIKRQCPKCNSPMKIVAIYDIELKEE